MPEEEQSQVEAVIAAHRQRMKELERLEKEIKDMREKLDTLHGAGGIKVDLPVISMDDAPRRMATRTRFLGSELGAPVYWLIDAQRKPA